MEAWSRASEYRGEEEAVVVENGLIPLLIQNLKSKI
jgi:hypothetical protein